MNKMKQVKTIEELESLLSEDFSETERHFVIGSGWSDMSKLIWDSLKDVSLSTGELFYVDIFDIPTAFQYLVVVNHVQGLKCPTLVSLTKRNKRLWCSYLTDYPAKILDFFGVG